MKRTIGPAPDNMLKDIHSKLMAFPILFRDKVEEECLWSTPTFYRKLKGPLNISNAEREKIIAVLDGAIRDLWDYFAKYRKDDE